MTIVAGGTRGASASTMSRLSLPERFARSMGAARKQATRRDGTTNIFQIRPAEMGDMDSIIGLIDEAASWLGREKNTDQWRRPWPDREARDRRIRRGIKSGRTWIVEDRSGPGGPRGTLVGTVSCGLGGNKKLWNRRERDESAVYISRLIISRKYAHRGIGASLINWAGLRGLQGWKAQWIRVDVWTSNLELQAYYKAQSFSHVRTCDFDNPWEYPSAALFQKPTTDIAHADATRFQEVH